jgi:hypothetical protein
MPTSHNPYAPHSKVSEPSVTVEESKDEAVAVENETAPLSVTSDSAEATEVSEDSVPEGPAVEVLAWVGEDKDRAKLALEAEEEGQQRVGLTKKLKELAE